jgi:hypothetical protein
MYSRAVVTLTVTLLIAALAIFLSVAAALGAFRPVTPAELATLGDFDRIELDAAGRMYITQGEQTAVAIDAPERERRKLNVTVRDKTLHIEPRWPWPGLLAPAGDAIRYDVIVRDLRALTLAGAGEVAVDGLEGAALELHMTGGPGVVAIDGLSTRQLTVMLADGAAAAVAGDAADQAVSISGDGNYAAGRLASETARVQLSGGAAVLRVSDALDVEIFGAGRVGYYGDPIVTQRIEGEGELERLGE